MKILPKTLPHLKLCAANYSQLMQIFGGKFLDKSSFRGLDDSASITVTKVFESEHTASLEFKQVDQKNKLNSFLLPRHNRLSISNKSVCRRLSFERKQQG